MFDQFIKDAASRFNLPTASMLAVVRGLLLQMTDVRTGGPEGFITLFRRAGLGDLITSWFGGKEGRPILPSHLEASLGTDALDQLAASSGLTRPAVSAAVAFLLPRLIGALTPNGVLPSRMALASQVVGYLDEPVAVPGESRIEHEEERLGWAGLVPWAALALLALAALYWWRTPAATMNPQLMLSNRDGKITYSGMVRDEATRSEIVSALATAFGEADINGDLRMDANVKPAAWLPRLGDLFAALKTPGVDLSLNGDAINLGGWLSSADRQALAEKLRGIVGAGVSVGSLGDPAVEAARAANDRAVSALRAIGTSGVAPDALVGAMNLAVINFPSGSAEIARDSLEVIRESAEAIKRAPADVKVEIGGHTDNTGNPTSNLALSLARADAVRGALVTTGVPAERLTARGYGDTRPRATNDTEFGRFQNRRIEYTVGQ